jgi:hypothetical protein
VNFFLTSSNVYVTIYVLGVGIGNVCNHGWIGMGSVGSEIKLTSGVATAVWQCRLFTGYIVTASKTRLIYISATYSTEFLPTVDNA